MGMISADYGDFYVKPHLINTVTLLPLTNHWGPSQKLSGKVKKFAPDKYQIMTISMTTAWLCTNNINPHVSEISQGA